MSRVSNVAISPIWDHNPGPVSGSTAYGYFDSDVRFQQDAPKFSKWAAYKLGYPISDVELVSGSFFNAFEEAVMEYSTQIHQYTIRENLLTLQGTPNNPDSPSYIDYTHVPIQSTFDRVIRLSDQYAQEAGVGGNITWKKVSIPITKSLQDYDLNYYISLMHESGSAIEVKKVHHYDPIAFGYGMSGMYNTAGGMGSAYSTLQSFGWENNMGGMANGLSYTLLPVYEDVLRMQAIELNHQIRRSTFSFDIKNNQLKIFPVPLIDFTLWVEYISKNDRLTGTYNEISGSGYIGSGSATSDRTSNVGDAPFTFMEYSKINDPGRRWIYKYGLACCKDMLGEVRSKYQSMPYAGNAELSLNGDALKQEAQSEKEALIAQIREDLEQASPSNQMLKQSEIAQNLQGVLNKIPLKLYVG